MRWNLVVPWTELVALIASHAPKKFTGRPPFAAETMLRIHFLQQWFGLSDLAMEEALFEVSMYRDFAELGSTERIPDRVSILRFRHLLEAHVLAQQILATVNATLAAKGLMRKSGTVVDATLIAAPSSTKNSTGERDPEMHQTRKGKQWHFGMMAHIGVDADSGLVHAVVGTAANVNDVTQASQLVHGEEAEVFADAATRGWPNVKKLRASRRVGMWPCAQASDGRWTRPARWVRCSTELNISRPACERRSNIRSGHQASVRPRQGALQGTGQEHGAVAHLVRIEQFVDGAAQALERGAGMSPPDMRQVAEATAKWPRKRRREPAIEAKRCWDFICWQSALQAALPRGFGHHP